MRFIKTNMYSKEKMEWLSLDKPAYSVNCTLPSQNGKRMTNFDREEFKAMLTEGKTKYVGTCHIWEIKQ